MGFWRPGGGHFATSEARKTARDGEGDREDAPRVFPKDTLRPEMVAFAESEREEVMEAMVPRTCAERMHALALFVDVDEQDRRLERWRRARAGSAHVTSL